MSHSELQVGTLSDDVVSAAIHAIIESGSIARLWLLSTSAQEQKQHSVHAHLGWHLQRRQTHRNEQSILPAAALCAPSPVQTHTDRLDLHLQPK